jgi:hypothetical protein
MLFTMVLTVLFIVLKEYVHWMLDCFIWHVFMRICAVVHASLDVLDRRRYAVLTVN